MSFSHGILNLTNWSGNVVLPTLAALFIAVAIIQFSKGAAYTHAMYGGFLCLMASGLLRAFETFASQRNWNDPNLFGAALVSLVDWSNVLLPLYAALQVVAGGVQLAGVTNRFQPISWMRHFAAAGLCLLVSGLLRLCEFFITKGTGGVT